MSTGSSLAAPQPLVETQQLSLSSSTTTVTSVWQRGSGNGWRTTLREPACFADADNDCVYVHGGKLPRQGNAVSCQLLQVSLAGVADPQLLYSEDDVIHRTAVPLAADSTDVASCPGPSRYGHILMHQSPYLVVHGGKDSFGITQSDVYGFHLEDKRWVVLKHLVGGCAPPRMSGHATAPFTFSHPGEYVVAGLEEQPNLRSGARHTKRPRPDSREALDARGAPGVSVFRLDLADFQRGWSRIVATNAATVPALHHITVSTHVTSVGAVGTDSHAQAFNHGGLDGMEDVAVFVLGEHQHTVGEQRETTETTLELWRLCVDSRVWQQVALCVGATPVTGQQYALGLQGHAATRSRLLLGRSGRVYSVLCGTAARYGPCLVLDGARWDDATMHRPRLCVTALDLTQLTLAGGSVQEPILPVSLSVLGTTLKRNVLCFVCHPQQETEKFRLCLIDSSGVCWYMTFPCSLQNA